MKKEYTVIKIHLKNKNWLVIWMLREMRLGDAKHYENQCGTIRI